MELLGQRQNGGRGKEEAIAKHEGEAEHEDGEADAKYEEGEACFTNARLKTLYSLFIWFAHLYHIDDDEDIFEEVFDYDEHMFGIF